MGHEHIRPTRTGAWGITVPTGMAKMEIQMYTDPPVGRVGMTTQEARASGKRVLVGYRPMSKVSRAREISETSGFMRALVDADTLQILGVFGVGGDEIVHSILDVMYAHAPYTTISRAVHIHPTISELIPTMLQGLKPLD